MKHEMMLTFMMEKLYPSHQASIPVDIYLQKPKKHNVPSSKSTQHRNMIRGLEAANEVLSVLL